MFDFLEKLQQKPRAYRRSVALMTSGAITLSIFFVWLSVHDFDFHDSSVAIESAEDFQARVLSPIETLRADLADARNAVANSIASFNGTTSTSTSPAADPDVLLGTTGTDTPAEALAERLSEAGTTTLDATSTATSTASTSEENPAS